MFKKSLNFQNEKPVRKLAKEALEIISRLLFLVGKPIFALLLLLFTLILHLFNITGCLSDKSFGLVKKICTSMNFLGLRKKSGVIFLASRENVKNKIFKIQKVIDTYTGKCEKKLGNYTNNLKSFFLKTEIFSIAVNKLIHKITNYLISKIKATFHLSLLKLSTFFSIRKQRLSKLILPKFSWVKLFSFILGIIFVTGLTGSLIFWNFILKDLPSPQELNSRKQKVSTKIYDRNGILLYNIYKDQNRTPVNLDEIPLHVKLATIAIEDAEFYSHPGFSVKGITRALIKNYKEKKLTGGSTITQQLVKNTLLSPEKTYLRKLKEITLAIKVELAFSKDEILEMYLNEVSYGGTAYGIQEASRTYFGKDVKKLSLAEAALLAGLPKSPTEYSPFGTNPELSLARQKEVLNLMEINGFITNDQKIAAESQEISFIDQKTDIKAPHFVMYIRQILEDKYGKSIIDSGGLEITTSLDYSIQKLAEKVIAEELDKLTKLNVTNAAVIVLNPKTGEILAMVGSKDYFDSGNGGNVNVTLRPRQPGSAIKIINYAYALSNGMNTASIITDKPVTFLVEGQSPYTPKNYEGNYRGNLTLRSALAESRNIPAVRVLASYGVDKMINLGRKMGITSWEDPKNYGLSLTLGGGEVILLDLARAYATIANYGERPEINPVLEIKNLRGEILQEFNCDNQKNIMTANASSSDNAFIDTAKTQCAGEKIIDPRVAYLITDILKDNTARSPTFGSNSLMLIPNHTEVAVKTGTSNNLRDNLTVGYNQNYLTAVWVGNNDNSPMERIASGITGATPIWNKIMTALLAESESKDWEIPEKLVKISVCPFTGTLACPGCSNKNEWFLEENKPQYACSPNWFLAKEESTNSADGKELNPNQEINNYPTPEIIKVEEKSQLPNKKRNILGSN